MVTAHISFMFYSFLFHLSQSDSRCTVPPLSLRWPSYLIYQLSAEVLSALAFQIETLLWLGPWDAVPSPWANTRLDSYHVSSHYQQSRALGRQWERSDRGGWGRARGPAIHHAAGPQSPPDTALKHSPTGPTCSQRPATPRWGSEQPHRPVEGKLQESAEFMPPKPGVAASSWEKNICQLLFLFFFLFLVGTATPGETGSKYCFFKTAKGGII